MVVRQPMAQGVAMKTRRARQTAESLPQAPCAAPADHYRLEEQVGFSLRLAQQRATDIFAEVMRSFDVTPMQFAALAKLDEVGPTSQNQLGRLIAMDPATTFSVIGRLVRRGWVAQAPDAGDARLVILSLTGQGKASVGEMKAIAAEVSRRTLAPLSEQETAQFLELLRRLT